MEKRRRPSSYWLFVVRLLGDGAARRTQRTEDPPSRKLTAWQGGRRKGGSKRRTPNAERPTEETRISTVIDRRYRKKACEECYCAGLIRATIGSAPPFIENMEKYFFPSGVKMA